MQASLQRAVTSTAVRLDDYRVSGKAVALRVFSPGCPACETFESRRAEFEKGLEVDIVFDVCADEERRRRMALDAGVRRVPAYIVLDGPGTPRVVMP